MRPSKTQTLMSRRAAWLGGLLVVGLVACSTVPSGTPNTPHQVWKEVMTLLMSDRPLAAIALTETPSLRESAYAQMALQMYALSGDEETTSRLLDESLGAREEAALLPVRVSPAVEVIAALAADRRVVILNESHYHQRHRAFAMQLALRLRANGFTHFAAEAFGPKVSEATEGGVPRLALGVYTLDPVFGDLVRQAAKAGYAFFDYEMRPEQAGAPAANGQDGIARREQAQAENIQRFLVRNPEARVLIYVGGSHGLKELDSFGNAWMASRLRAVTGVEPLSIDQLAGTPHFDARYDDPSYTKVFELSELDAPVVAFDGQGRGLTRSGYDLMVFHPRNPDVAGRPGWLAVQGHRKPTQVRLAAAAARTMLRAHLKREPAGAVAMDQVLVQSGQTLVHLMLPTGEYRLSREDIAGNSEELGEVRIE